MASYGVAGNTPGAPPPYTISAEIDEDAVERICHTENFNVDEFVVIRRGTTIPIQLNARSLLSLESATLVYDEGENPKEIAVPIEKLNSRVYGSTFEASIEFKYTHHIRSRSARFAIHRQKRGHLIYHNYSKILSRLAYLHLLQSLCTI